MSTNSVRRPDSSVLGESWVVTDSNSKSGQRTVSSEARNRQDELKPKRRNTQPAASRAFRTTSASSMSGPELIMPSIYDDNISEASWIAPMLRLRESPSNLAQKTDLGSSKQQQKQDSEPGTSKVDASIPSVIPSGATESLFENTRAMILSLGLERYIKMIVTVFLLLPILHILVLPELLYQYPKFCAISAVSALYPASCTQRNLSSQGNGAAPSDLLMLSKYQSIVAFQTQLEALLNATGQEISVVPSPLKNSESKLRELHIQLKTTYAGAKHEFDLEFQGAWTATRSASLELDLLKADIMATMDRLEEESRATRQSLKIPGSTQKRGEVGGKGFSNGLLARFSWRRPTATENVPFPSQISRHAQVLHRQGSLIKSRTDSLLGYIATLNEHLESIEDVVSREEERASSVLLQDNMKSLVSDPIRWILQIPSPFRRVSNTPAHVASSNASMSNMLREAKSHHRHVADVLGKLGKQLQILQKSRH